jgi:hypothetical protein
MRTGKRREKKETRSKGKIHESKLEEQQQRRGSKN